MSTPSAEVDPASPEYGWIEAIVEAVSKLTGHPAAWNGRAVEEPDPTLLGTAGPDGTLTLNREHVIQPLRMIGSATLTPRQVQPVYEAVLAIVHESTHLCAADGDPAAPEAHPIYDPAGVALEEGLADALTHQIVADVIVATDLDKQLPAILDCHAPDSYPALRAATAILSYGVGELAGMRGSQAAALLHATPRAQRWNTAADLLLDNALRGSTPAAERAAARGRFVTTLRTHFAVVLAIEDDDGLDSTTAAIEGGMTVHRLLAKLSADLAELRRGRPRSPSSVPAREVQQLRRFIQPSPSPTARARHTAAQSTTRPASGGQASTLGRP